MMVAFGGAPAFVALPVVATLLAVVCVGSEGARRPRMRENARRPRMNGEGR